VRTHGTLTKWNDDRGFGFITPAKGTADVFVHFSAFPRDGVRPHIGELISFETEAGPDGRNRAVRVMRPGQQHTPRQASRSSRSRSRIRWREAVLVTCTLGALISYGYSRFTSRIAPEQRFSSEAPPKVEQSSPYRCDGRTRCTEMKSCAEARFFIQNCPNTKMDGDNDGVPCEGHHCAQE
jgi:cold shock CspA family protein